MELKQSGMILYPHQSFLERPRGIDLYRVPLVESPLPHELPSRLDVFGLDHGDDHVVGSEDVHGDDVHAQTLGKPGDLLAALDEQLASGGVRRGAKVWRMLGGDDKLHGALPSELVG